MKTGYIIEKRDYNHKILGYMFDEFRWTSILNNAKVFETDSTNNEFWRACLKSAPIGRRSNPNFFHRKVEVTETGIKKIDGFFDD